jgi:hypothetical protein
MVGNLETITMEKIIPRKRGTKKMETTIPK